MFICHEKLILETSTQTIQQKIYKLSCIAIELKDSNAFSTGLKMLEITYLLII